jgi:hypothetical protein
VRPDTNPADALDLAVEPCEDCTATIRWERRDLTPTSEAWLGTCEECGSMTAFVLGEPDREIKDPLSFFLLGTESTLPAPQRPAWQRFFALTTGAPYFLRWSFESMRCNSCKSSAKVGTHILSPAWRRALTLCLNCGHATVETTFHVPGSEVIRLEGRQWAPPDPAVKTLRETVLETYRRWVEFQEWRRRSAGEEPGTD